MQTPSILVVLGNRPQFIKHAALARVWASRTERVRPVVVDTGQHYDYALAGVFMDELKIPAPDHALGVGSASHAEQLARMLPPLEELMIRIKPASVVLYGDTNSTLGGALVASKLNIPIAHIEAGLRSLDMTMPEEVNRVMTDHVSSLLFAPTDRAIENLAAEGISGERVHRVGDVMADIALAVAPAADTRWQPLADKLQLPGPGTFGVVTAHRASNTEPDALRNLIDALRIIAAEMPLVMPVHPRTEAAAVNAGLHVDLTSIDGLTLLPPLGYVDMTALMRHARAVITDSGGLQKEAYVHNVPCVTLRDTTEWVETIDAGWNTLAFGNAATISSITLEHIAAVESAPPDHPDLYGDGTAAETIMDVLEEHAVAMNSLRI